MTIPIQTNTDLIYKQYLTIINGVLSKSKKLTSLEIDVLDKMLIIDNMYKHLPKEHRDAIIFHRTTKDKIIESLYKMSIQSYDNILVKLRKKGMIEGKSLKIYIPTNTNGNIDIIFKLNLVD